MFPEALSAIEDGQHRIKVARQEYARDAEERLAEEKEKIAQQWQPHLQAILSETPSWADGFLEVPTEKPEVYDDGVWMHRPAIFTIPEVGTIYAYNFSRGVRFLPVEWGLQDDEETYTVAPTIRAFWYQYEEPGYTNFNVALAYAHDFFKRIPDLQRDADERNARRATANVAPKIGGPNDWGIAQWQDEAIRSWRNGEGLQAVTAALMTLIHLERQRF